jgi:hypothetical protein
MAPATWLRFGAFLHHACAQQRRLPVTVLIATACRVFENALRLPLAPPHVKQDFRPSSRFQIDELAGLRRFVPTGESGEAFTHVQSVGCFGYRRLAQSKFLAPSTQPFELGPGAVPLASGVKRLFAARSLLPYSNLRCCRSLARLHLRSQQPAAFQLSLFCDRPLFDWNSRSRRASEQIFRPGLLRRDCGSQPMFQASTLFRGLPL